MPSPPPEPEPLARLLWRAHTWFRTALIDTLAAEDEAAREKLVRLTPAGRRRRAETIEMLARLEAALAERIGKDAVAGLRTADCARDSVGITRNVAVTPRGGTRA